MKVQIINEKSGYEVGTVFEVEEEDDKQYKGNWSYMCGTQWIEVKKEHCILYKKREIILTEQDIANYKKLMKDRK